MLRRLELIIGYCMLFQLYAILLKFWGDDYSWLQTLTPLWIAIPCFLLAVKLQPKKPVTPPKRKRRNRLKEAQNV